MRIVALIIRLVQIYGGDDYKTLMKRLSAESSSPPSGQPRFDSIWDELKYLAGRARRRLNKYRGLPATEDVGVLSTLIKQLRFECEKRLGRSITSAVAVVPMFPGLTAEDLEDAMQYAGVGVLRSYNTDPLISETSAAFTGTDYGLCSNPRDIDACEDKEAVMPRRRLLAIGLTDSLLTITYDICQDAYFAIQRTSIIKEELGLQGLDRYNNPSFYWNSIRTAIVNVTAAASKPINTPLLLGEHGANEKLLNVIRNALGGVQSPLSSANLYAFQYRDPLYVAARGAAEFARRFQRMPWGCKELVHCFEDAKLVNQQNLVTVDEESEEL